MEDIKKIQEFFSKSIKEGKKLDQVDFAKVVQAVTKTGHPVTVLFVPKWNEIEVLTGMDAPDNIILDLSNAVDSLGYGRNDIIIAGDSSNLSRREYSDIRRVNGGAKDYFEEATKEEENDFHKKLDTLVHKTFGHSSDEKKKMNEVSKGALNYFSDLKYNYQKAFRYLDVEEREEYKQLVKDFFSKIQIDDKVRAVGLNEKKIKKSHGEKISKEVFAKLKGKTINYKGEEYKVVDADEAVIKLDPVEAGKQGKTVNLNQFNVSGLINEILETIKLGQQLNEELCEKGKRYIKARQAAGEKSSAYLSGRAVRVCKGQIEWPKKGKKNESLNEATNVEDEMFSAMKNLAASLEKANDNVKPSPKDEKLEEGVITIGATVIGAPGLMSALGKGANYLGKAFGKDKTKVGEFLKKKGHQLEEFYIESLGGWIKAAFPNKYQGQDIKDESSELHEAAQKAYAAMLTLAAIGAGYEAGAAANVVKAGIEGGMAVLKTKEVIDIVSKLV
jgi:hypothetical protein